MKTKIIPLVTLILFISELFSTGIHVPANDPVYTFLDRMAILGQLPGYLSATKPLRRDEISHYLSELSQKSQPLTITDRKIIADYLTEYRYELTAEKHPDIPKGKHSSYLLSAHQLRRVFDRKDKRDAEETHFYMYEESGNLVWFDINGLVRIGRKNQASRALGGLGLRISSQLGDRLSFYVDATGYLWQVKSGFKDLPQEVQSTYLQDETTIDAQYYDETTAYFQYQHPVIGTFSINHEQLMWGNTPNSMILSDNAAPFGFVMWQKRFKRAKYTFVHGSLHNQNVELDTISNIKYLPQKYFAGHRLEVNIVKNVNFTFTEMLIYGNRDIEFDYLNPVSFYHVSEHDQRDRDNNLMAIELEWFPINGVKLFGNVLIDELKVTELFSSWWANKQGFQLGAVFTPRQPTMLRLEWTAIRPWTYTHKIEENTFTHNGECLGFYAGPNSQLFYLENIWLFSPRFNFCWTYSRLKHGNDLLTPSDPGYYPAGGDANQSYDDRNRDYDDTTKWLMGSIETTEKIGFLLTCRYTRELYVDCGLTFQRIDKETDTFFVVQTRIDL